MAAPVDIEEVPDSFLCHFKHSATIAVARGGQALGIVLMVAPDLAAYLAVPGVSEFMASHFPKSAAGVIVGISIAAEIARRRNLPKDGKAKTSDDGETV